jgi:NAD(P)-dependent dehydrogenase (short-subunit alcohol dehydrogenase family)
MQANEKVVLVTGASRGIGKAVAEGFVDAGYQVVVAARSVEPLQALVERAEAKQMKALAVPCDVTVPESVDALFGRIRDEFGRIDVLFNNAGVALPATPVDQLTFEQWKSVLDTNMTGVFLCMRGAVALMKQQEPRGGRIINNGSISAYAPRPFSVPYTSTKHGVLGMSRSLALEGRNFDIACSQIDIGNAATEMAIPMASGCLQANGSVAPEPLLDLRHVVDAVLFMASLPLQANIPNLTIMPTGMPFVGRG